MSKYQCHAIKILTLGSLLLGCEVSILESKGENKGKKQRALQSLDSQSFLSAEDVLSERSKTRDLMQKEFLLQLPTIISNLADQFETRLDLETSGQNKKSIGQSCLQEESKVSLNGVNSEITINLDQISNCSAAELQTYNDLQSKDEERYEIYSARWQMFRTASYPGCHFDDVTHMSWEDIFNSSKMEKAQKCMQQADSYKVRKQVKYEGESKTLAKDYSKGTYSVVLQGSNETQCQVQRIGDDAVFVKSCFLSMLIQSDYQWSDSDGKPTGSSVFSVTGAELINTKFTKNNPNRSAVGEMTGGEIKLLFNNWSGTLQYRDGQIHYAFSDSKDGSSIAGELSDVDKIKNDWGVEPRTDIKDKDTDKKPIEDQKGTENDQLKQSIQDEFDSMPEKNPSCFSDFLENYFGKWGQKEQWHFIIGDDFFTDKIEETSHFSLEFIHQGRNRTMWFSKESSRCSETDQKFTIIFYQDYRDGHLSSVHRLLEVKKDNDNLVSISLQDAQSNFDISVDKLTPM